MTEQPWWHTPGQTPPPGPSAAEEAGRLFTAVRDRLLSDPAALRAGAKLLDAFSQLSAAASDAPASTGPAVEPGEAPECAYCPVCQAMSRARAMSPQTVERLTGATLEFAETVRQIVLHPEARSPDPEGHNFMAPRSDDGDGDGDGDDDAVWHVPLDDDAPLEEDAEESPRRPPDGGDSHSDGGSESAFEHSSHPTVPEDR